MYTVGLDGLNDDDHDELNGFATEGWEPFLMTAVHGGFGTLVLFRRETGVPPPVREKAAVRKAAPVKKAKAAKKVTAARRR